MAPDQFPEAFDRFEDDVDLSRIKTFTQLTLEFMMWGRERVTLSNKQMKALKVEASERRIGYINITYTKYGRKQYRNARTGQYLKKEEYENLKE